MQFLMNCDYGGLNTKKCVILNVYYNWDQGRNTHTFKKNQKNILAQRSWSQSLYNKIAILYHECDPKPQNF